MSDIKTIMDELTRFRDDRDWEQFHNPKDLALAISVEAGELLELFLWKEAAEAKVEKVKEELADVLTFSFLMRISMGWTFSRSCWKRWPRTQKNTQWTKPKGTPGNTMSYEHDPWPFHLDLSV